MAQFGRGLTIAILGIAVITFAFGSLTQCGCAVVVGQSQSQSTFAAHDDTNTAPTRVATRPARPIMAVIVVTYRRPSVSVIPLILQITQNPLSFIHGNGFEPQPIANTT